MVSDTKTAVLLNSHLLASGAAMAAVGVVTTETG